MNKLLLKRLVTKWTISYERFGNKPKPDGMQII